MAWLEQKSSKQYLIAFRINGQKIKRTLKTKSRKRAQVRLGRIEETIGLIESGRLTLPHDADLVSFIMSDGRLATPFEPQTPLTIKQLDCLFRDSLPVGSLENNTLAAMKIHFRHLCRILGKSKQVASLSTSDLQTYVTRRSKEKGRRGRTVSTKTIKMELASFRMVWNWGRTNSHVAKPFPNRGLRYAKTEDRPPFRTRKQIENLLEGENGDSSKSELWECLFLYEEEIRDVVDTISENSTQPFLQPMCAAAAYTGARRGELLRSRIEDIDLERRVFAIRERKRIKSNRSIRTVPIADPLHRILVKWMDNHPGGPWTFCLADQIKRERPITPNQLKYYRTAALRSTRWDVLHGWHTFRHSFISACACQGIDQRIIDSWVGHQTDEMRRRYRHLFPEVERKAIQKVFS